MKSVTFKPAYSVPLYEVKHISNLFIVSVHVIIILVVTETKMPMRLQVYQKIRRNYLIGRKI